MKMWPLILIAFMVFSFGAFCAEPYALESKRDGAWWSSATWDPERLPKAGNKVHICSEHAVVFEAKSLNLIPFLHVEGSLVFACDPDTELNVAVFKVGGGREAHSGVADMHGHKTAPIRARLEVGTPGDPIPVGVTARIRLHSLDGPYSLTFSGLSGIPFIQLSEDNMNGKAETDGPNLKIEDRRDGNDDARRRPLVDRGGGKRTKDPVLSGVPVVGHDLFVARKHAKFVSSRDVQHRKDKESYREEQAYTDGESRVTDASEGQFQKLLDSIDDQRPATIVTWPKGGLPVTLERRGHARSARHQRLRDRRRKGQRREGERPRLHLSQGGVSN